MSRTIGLFCAVAFALPVLARAQGEGQATPACPTSGPATETSIRTDSVSRRQSSSADSARRGNSGAGQQIGTTPDIILRASVSAKEIRFAQQPHISIRLCGGTLDSVRVVERRNLPTPVVAGTTYRDVYVAIEILGHLTGSCIANTLSGGRAASSSGLCASLGIRDSVGAQRAPPTRRPQ